jgi:serine protease Do
MMTAARTSRPALAAALLCLISLSARPLHAEPATPVTATTKAVKAITWDAARTTSPDSVGELKALQERVKQVVHEVTPSTVGLLVGMGAGSGVIVSEDGLILTAAHVIGKPGRTIRVVLADGTIVKGKTLGLNAKTDSGMVRITDKPPKDAKWPGAKEGKWPAVKLGHLPRYGSDDEEKLTNKGQWVISLGHPGGPKKDRPPAVRVGRFETYRKSETALRTDCTLVGGDSGGPLFDLNGKLVGIHSRIGMFLEYNMHVPTEAFEQDWKKLLAGAVMGKATRVLIGVTFEDDEESAKIRTVSEGGPAEKAGIEPGDVITKFDGEKVHITDDLLQLLPAYDPGDRVTVEVQRGDKALTLRLTLGRKRGRQSRDMNE